MCPEDPWDFEEDYHESGRKRADRKERHLKSYKDRKHQPSQKRQPSEEFFSESLKKGRVLSISKEGIHVCDEQRRQYLCVLKGSLKKQRTQQKNLIIVGDFVFFSDTGAAIETIFHVQERFSLLSRADHLSRKKQQLIAANIDQAFITVCLYYPYLKPALIDRYLIAAKKGKMEGVLVINKMDLLAKPPERLDSSSVDIERKLFENILETYTKIGIEVLLVSTVNNEGISDLQKKMQQKASVFVGQSGVGKTSLINASLKKNLPTGKVVWQTGKGAHTTTSAVLLPIEGEGFVIDTPGIKSFGLWELTAADIRGNFPEINGFAQDCRFPNCLHIHEPDCAVRAAVAQNNISLMRYESYTTLIEESLQKDH